MIYLEDVCVGAVLIYEPTGERCTIVSLKFSPYRDDDYVTGFSLDKKVGGFSDYIQIGSFISDNLVVCKRKDKIENLLKD